MGIVVITLLAVVLFFGLALYTIRKDERRRSDRRQLHQPRPLEQRGQDRRSNNLFSYLAWVVRSLGSKLTK
jgi:hypothetical protein